MIYSNSYEILQKKKELIDHYYDNFLEYYHKKEFSKASEYLWGVLNNIVTSIALFYGRKNLNHKQIIEFIEILSIEYNNEDLLKQCNSAEKIHANYFHDFMNEDVFEEEKEKMLQLFKTLNEILDEKEKQLYSSTF